VGVPKGVVELADILKVISEPNRLKILCLLKCECRCVCEIYERLDLKQNLVSHHLKVLKDAGLIDVKRDGQWKNYSLNTDNIKKYKDIFNKLLT